MTTEAQLAANLANSQKSTGPTSASGRAKSAMNALKHGLRSKKAALLREDSYAFETRKQKWMAQYEPQTDAEEFLLHTNVILSCELARTWNAGLERRRARIEASEEDELEEVRVLGKRLFFDPSGAMPPDGDRVDPPGVGKHKTSFSGKSVEPDDPVPLLKALEATEKGCFWLFERWEELRARLAPGKHWRSSDEFKAIRLLGAQPADAIVERSIAEILVASDVIQRVKTRASSLTREGPFTELASDAGLEVLDNLEEEVRKEWPDLVRAGEKEKARQILIDLVDENVERLAAKLESFVEKVDDLAETRMTRLSFDHRPQGERLRSYLLKFKNGLERGIRSLKKSKAERDQGGWNEPRREVEGRPGAREDVDLSWAYEAGRALDRGAQPVAGAPIGDGVGSERADAMVDAVSPVRLTESGDTSRLDSQRAIVDGSDLNSGADAGGVNAVVTVECPGETGNDRRGQIRENVTNEANFAENVVGCQVYEAIGVTANFGVDSGLDKGRRPLALGADVWGFEFLESGDPKSVLEWADRAGSLGAPHPDLLPASAAREDVDGDPATSRTANRKSHPPQADNDPKSKGRGAGRPSLTPGLIRDGALLTRVSEGTKASSRSLAIEEQLIGRILASSPTVAEIVRRQLPRAP